MRKLATRFLVFTFIALISFISIMTLIGSEASATEYHPLDEVLLDMETVAMDHPEIVTLHNLSEEYDAPLTHQNRSLLAMRVTDADNDES